MKCLKRQHIWFFRHCTREAEPFIEHIFIPTSEYNVGLLFSENKLNVSDLQRPQLYLKKMNRFTAYSNQEA